MSKIIEESIKFDEKDVKCFCELTNDPNLIHTNIEVAKRNGFKKLVVNGALTYAVSIGKLMGTIKGKDGVLILETTSTYKRIVETEVKYNLRIDLIDT